MRSETSRPSFPSEEFQNHRRRIRCDPVHYSKFIEHRHYSSRCIEATVF